MKKIEEPKLLMTSTSIDEVRTCYRKFANKNHEKKKIW